MSQRFAVYYAPAATDLLWDRAAVWLGRDPQSSVTYDGPVAGMDRTRLLNLTQSAGRYGFHATLKPPMALAPGQTEEGLRIAMAAVAAELAPVRLGRLTIANLDGFLALVPAEADNAQLQDLAASVVEAFEPFRAPLNPRDRAARAAHGLTPRQEELLDAYGYPYVFDEFRFHMTLTDRLSEADRADMLQAAQTWFGPVLDQEVMLDRLSLFHERENKLPFNRIADFALGGAER
jgi:putative phosphonate metabolism protein